MLHSRHRYPLVALMALALFSFTACDPDVEIVEVEVPATPTFAELPTSVDPNRRAFSMRVMDYGLLLQGERRHFIYDEAGEFSGSFSGSGAQYVQPFNEDYMIAVYPEAIQVHSIVGGRAANSIRVYPIDSILPQDASAYPFRPGPYSSPAELDKNNILILPYITGEFPDRNIGFALHEFEGAHPSGFGANYDIVASVFIDSDIRLINSQTYRTIPVEGGFLFHYWGTSEESAIYRIDYSGNMVKVYSESPGVIDGFIEYQNAIYAWRDSDTGNGHRLMRAEPDGRNWELLDSTYNGRAVTYFPAGEDELIMLDRQQDALYYVEDLGAGTPRYTRLQAEQFEGYIVTDVERYGDFVYVTTMSGSFRRDWREFIESRDVEGE